MATERVVKTTRVYEGRVVSLRVDEVELPSGRRARREIVEHRGAVAVVPLTAEGNILLVRQYRSAAGRALLEIPAGTIELGEPVTDCLHRELGEEVGMRAGWVEPLVSFLPSPGFLTEQVHIFLAGDLSPSRSAGQRGSADAEEEGLAVVSVPLAEARDLVARGEIVDAKSIIGIMLSSARMGTAPGRPR